MFVSLGNKTPVLINLKNLVYACPNKPRGTVEPEGTMLMVDDGTGTPRHLVVDQEFSSVIEEVLDVALS